MTSSSESHKLSALLKRLNTQCSKASVGEASTLGISEAQSRALSAFDSECSVRIGELARRMGLAPSRLTRLVDSMVAGGLVHRAPDPTDRRGTVVSLTPEGCEARDRLESVCERRYKKIVKGLAGPRRGLLLELLGELVHTMEGLEIPEDDEG